MTARCLALCAVGSGSRAISPAISPEKGGPRFPIGSGLVSAAVRRAGTRTHQKIPSRVPRTLVTTSDRAFPPKALCTAHATPRQGWSGSEGEGPGPALRCPDPLAPIAGREVLALMAEIEDMLASRMSRGRTYRVVEDCWASVD